MKGSRFLLPALALGTLVSSLFLASPAGAVENVKVRLFSSAKALRQITFLGPATLKIARSEIAVQPPFTIEKSQANLVFHASGSQHLKGLVFRSCLISPATNAPMPLSINLPRRVVHSYEGQFQLSLDRSSKLQIINLVGKREYIDGVVASEAPPGSPPEMLKAQAVLAQTLLGHVSGLIDDSTQSQRYAGYSSERPEVAAAVAAVWDSQISYKNKPIQVFFHSTCAGGTSSAQSFFHLAPGSLPYLTHVTCQYCKDSPFFARTQLVLPTATVASLYKGAPPVILATDQSKRPLEIGIGKHKVSGYEYWIRFGQKFGWDKLPGTRFAIENLPKGETVISSSGAGHGVGLCQWGAIGLAKAGKTYKEILKYYFPDCDVQP